MTKRAEQQPAEFIMPLNMNGLQGRMLVMPAPKNHKREILFIYGQHSSIERWWGLIQEMNRYGAVTVPDLPGFGGMEGLYKIGQQPTIDNMADYLAAFIKLRFGHKRLTIMGLSLGFAIATRMLQRYPDLVKKVDMMISVVGFAHHEDFRFTRSRFTFYRYGSALFVHRPFHLVLHGALNPRIMRRMYHRSFNAKEKFAGKDEAAFAQTMDTEIALWKMNDVRTWLKTTSEMLTLDNCRVSISLPVWHVSVKDDKYFDEQLVEQHFRVIFSDYHHFRSSASSHGPSVVATAKEAAPMIPNKLRRLLAKD